ncbi:MAG: type VI secretion system baseplate subunit TssK [Myxococcota bacterium]
METSQKVLWKQGMFLTPHHFQQRDRYAEHSLRTHTRQHHPFGHGLVELHIDEDSLAVGDTVITRAAGVFPDGTPFSVPEQDDRPASRSLAGLFDAQGALFDATHGARAVYLGMPLVRPGVPASAPDGAIEGQATRYRTTGIQVRDELSGGDGQEILVGRLNLRILLEGESLEDYTVLEIAEVQRDTTGRIVLNPTYVPPCISIGASPRLEAIIRRVLETLTARSSELAAQRRNRGAGLVDYAMSETANFALLTILNSHIPPLRHFHHQHRAHPEQVYLELCRLCGGLLTLASEGSPKDLPLYLHDDLTTTFRELELTLDEVLRVVIPARSLRLATTMVRPNWFEIALPDGVRAGGISVYLGMAADVAGEKVIRETPTKIKMAGPETMEFLVAQSLHGMGIDYLPSPPAELPLKPDWHYFRLQSRGEYWNEATAAGRLAVFLPAEFRSLQLECFAVED